MVPADKDLVGELPVVNVPSGHAHTRVAPVFVIEKETLIAVVINDIYGNDFYSRKNGTVP